MPQRRSCRTSCASAVASAWRPNVYMTVSFRTVLGPRSRSTLPSAIMTLYHLAIAIICNSNLMWLTTWSITKAFDHSLPGMRIAEHLCDAVRSDAFCAHCFAVKKTDPQQCDGSVSLFERNNQKPVIESKFSLPTLTRPSVRSWASKASQRMINRMHISASVQEQL